MKSPSEIPEQNVEEDFAGYLLKSDIALCIAFKEQLVYPTLPQDQCILNTHRKYSAFPHTYINFVIFIENLEALLNFVKIFAVVWVAVQVWAGLATLLQFSKFRQQGVDISSGIFG